MSPLKLVRFVDYDANYAYLPPEREATINTDEIVSVIPIERESTRSRLDGVLRIRFRDGSSLNVIGKLGDFMHAPSQEMTRGSIQGLAYNALRCDGAHHKQWFLEEILKLVSAPEEYERVKDEWKPGIEP